MSIDLHVHSTASDGVLAPDAVVAEAALAGLHAIALTDHDSVEGVAAALTAGAERGLRVVPAVELSATARDGRDLHILGYRIDHTDKRLLKRLEQLRERRRERAMAMIAALRKGGYALDPDDVMRMAGEGALGRAHIARALEATGKVPSAGDAFRHLIGRGGPYYVPKPGVTPEEMITLIRSSCGIPVLAHPGITRVDDLLGKLVDAGLQGIEVWHSEHTAADTKRYAEIARRRGLVATGGSDYHGPHASGGGKRLGGVEVPDSVLESLYEVERGPACD
ncbi:MAG TPA: PHP domain-containing protein [Coriobacteriia bacterium]